MARRTSLKLYDVVVNGSSYNEPVSFKVGARNIGEAAERARIANPKGFYSPRVTQVIEAGEVYGVRP